MASTNKRLKRNGKETTTIRIKVSTKKFLEKEASFGETHDSLIRRALEMHKLKKAKSSPKEKEIANKIG